MCRPHGAHWQLETLLVADVGCVIAHLVGGGIPRGPAPARRCPRAVPVPVVVPVAVLEVIVVRAPRGPVAVSVMAPPTGPSSAGWAPPIICRDKVHL